MRRIPVKKISSRFFSLRPPASIYVALNDADDAADDDDDDDADADDDDDDADADDAADADVNAAASLTLRAWLQLFAKKLN